MHQCKSALHIWVVGESLVELGNLGSEQQAFVDDQPGGERRNVEEILLANVGFSNLGVGAAADHVENAFQLVLGEAVLATHENLFDVGLSGAGGPADRVAIDGRVAPAGKYG